MSEHPSLVVQEREKVSEVVAVPENLETLKQRVSELQKNQGDRRQTIQEIITVIEQLTNQDLELEAMQKKLLALIIKRLGSS